VGWERTADRRFLGPVVVGEVVTQVGLVDKADKAGPSCLGAEHHQDPPVLRGLSVMGAKAAGAATSAPLVEMAAHKAEGAVEETEAMSRTGERAAPEPCLFGLGRNHGNSMI
jgi:hypothetical protein